MPRRWAPDSCGNAAMRPLTATIGAAASTTSASRSGCCLLNINIRDLILWNEQNGEPFFSTTDNSEGGLVIFATIAGPNSNKANNNYGIRVFGSNDIPLPGGIGVSADPTGVTVVTDQAMYVIGDYNRGTVNGGIARQPASLIGDSVNVFSSDYWRSGVAAICGLQLLRRPVLPRRPEHRSTSPAAGARTEHLGQRRLPRRRRQHESASRLQRRPRELSSLPRGLGRDDADLPGIVRLPRRRRRT